MLAAEIVDLLFVPAAAGAPAGVVALLRHPPEPERLLPIYIGEREGEAIARRMMDEPFIRPLTHDLLEKILDRGDLEVLKLEIDALQDGTFLAQLYLVDLREGTVMMIDARPSDGMVLATGAQAPIYVSRAVLDAAGEPYERWREHLEREPPPDAPPVTPPPGG
jgi:bifunctional DNase/RNase